MNADNTKVRKALPKLKVIANKAQLSLRGAGGSLTCHCGHDETQYDCLKTRSTCQCIPSLTCSA